MSAGLAALLDDIAALAKLAAASVDDVSAAAGRASAKAAGVAVDDAAVTPRFVQGVTPARELPIIKQIAVGSLRNKLLFILPAALLLSQFAPWLLTPILMLGGAYLCFEGAEKVWEWIGRHDEEAPAVVQGPKKESEIVSGAIRTDFILSAEIMVISLNEVAAETFWSRAAVLGVVAVLMTAVVYGAVGIIIKMDDVGLRLAARDSPTAQRVGRGLVKGMKHILQGLSVVGVVAMLWVGGHIWLVGTDDLGWRTLYDAVHHLEEAVAAAVPGIGGFLAWLVNTVASAALGLAVGGLIVAVTHVLRWGGHGGRSHQNEDSAAGADSALAD